jgi:hypothetical protein
MAATDRENEFLPDEDIVALVSELRERARREKEERAEALLKVLPDTDGPGLPE